MADHGAVPPGLSADEQRAWFELQAWQREFVGRSRPHPPDRGGSVPVPVPVPVPGPGPGPGVAVRESAGRGAGELRGVDPVEVDGAEAVAARLHRSLLAVTAAITDPAAGERVRTQHRRVLGHEPTVATVGALELSVLDRIAARGAFGRAVTSVGVGGVTGSVAAGAGVAGLATGGLATGAAIGVMALAALAEATFVVLQASRTTARTAAVYGFDPRDPDEQAAVLAVVGAALARRRDRAVALGRSHHITGLIAAQVAHGSVGPEAARFLTRQLHHGLVLSLSGQQARRGVPVVGAALGSATTVRLSRHVDEVARQLYRDRFLRRRPALSRFATSPLGAGQFGPG